MKIDGGGGDDDDDVDDDDDHASDDDDDEVHIGWGITLTRMMINYYV